jgi:hypothetical protein
MERAFNLFAVYSETVTPATSLAGVISSFLTFERKRNDVNIL